MELSLERAVGGIATREAVSMLGSLAQGSRLDAFRLLVKAGPAGLPAGAIAESLQIPAPTLSFHLKEMRAAGIVNSQRQGRSLIYRADYEAMGRLLDFLTHQCCRGVSIKGTCVA